MLPLPLPKVWDMALVLSPLNNVLLIASSSLQVSTSSYYLFTPIAVSLIYHHPGLLPVP